MISLIAVLVFWLPGFGLLRNAAAGSFSVSVDSCRSLDISAVGPDAAADVVVIGSGPGGTGFLYRLLQRSPNRNTTVLWIEKGGDFLANNWPEDLVETEQPVLTPIPRRKMNWVQGYTWNIFGGGDAGNSGGPNYLGLIPETTPQERDIADLVFQLRNNSQTPLTVSTKRWRQAFSESGFEVVPGGVLQRRGDLLNELGQVSTLRSQDGRSRILIAEQIRSKSQITFVRGRASSIIHVNGKAMGVRGFRIQDGLEHDECVYWTAHQAVVLAAGVFHSFDILVESGIGKERDLRTRRVPSDWWIPNANVGTNIGDELLLSLGSLEPEQPDTLDSEPRLAAQTANGASLTYWSTGLFEWTFFMKQQTLGPIFKSKWFPTGLVRSFMNRVGIWTIGVPSGPVMSLVALEVPVQGSSLAIEIDDSEVVLTPDDCAAVRAVVTPWKRGVELEDQEGSRSILLDFAFFVFRLILLFLQPTVATKYNVDEVVSECRLEMFAVYYHAYGGNSDVVDETYRVMPGLYVSDASVIPTALPGALASTTMEIGMRVADTIIEQLDH